MKILQARPVTTFFSWTDWELEHEFDTAMPSNKEINTRGNLGEAFLGAATPLMISSVIKPFDLAIAQACVPKSDKSVLLASRLFSMFWMVFINILKQHRTGFARYD